jgi:hypothetical protein
MTVAVLLSGCRQGQTTDKAAEDLSCRHFVQDFYAWYVPSLQQMDAPERAVQNKPELFMATLLQSLKDDFTAQAKSKEIDGMDFDPFVGGQDFGNQYDTGQTTLTGNRCSVEVWHSSSSGLAPSTKPDVVAELVRDQAGWRFSNFRYPDLKTDLIRVLASLAEARRKN